MSELVKIPNSKVRADEIKQQIESLPIPRSVRLSPRTKLELAGHVVFLLLCEAIIWFSTVRPDVTHKLDRTTATILFGAFNFLLVWQFCAGLFNLLRGSFLLRQGQVAVAVVTKQWKFGRRNSRSKIQYSFTTPAGEKESGEGVDQTGGFFQEMSVIAFYNPSRPSKNVAYSCTGWRIKLSDNSLVEP
jgi:hypothetical protein